MKIKDLLICLGIALVSLILGFAAGRQTYPIIEETRAIEKAPKDTILPIKPDTLYKGSNETGQMQTDTTAVSKMLETV